MSMDLALFIVIAMLFLFNLSVSLSFKTIEKKLDVILEAIKISVDIFDKNEQIVNLLLTDYASKERKKSK